MKTLSDKIAFIKTNYSISRLVKELGFIPNTQGKIKSIYKNEKTPSLQLYKDDRYYCFATGKGGDVIDFYKDYHGISFEQAVLDLSRQLNMSSVNQRRDNKQVIKYKDEIKLLSSERELFDEWAGKYEYDAHFQRYEAERLAKIDLQKYRIESAAEVYMSLYERSHLSDEGWAYLMSEKRKLNEISIRDSKIFTTDRNTISFLKDTFPLYHLLCSGLFNTKGRFIFQNHGLIIPYTENTKITYLRARQLPNQELRHKLEKYYSPYNLLKHLSSKRFYNIDTLKHTSQKMIYITEGEADALKAEQAGQTAIAIPGVSNFPADCINILDPFDIALAFDSDSAGQEAIVRIARLFNRTVYKVVLGEYKDLTEAL